MSEGVFRTGNTIMNHSGQFVYIALGRLPANPKDYFCKVAPGCYLELPDDLLDQSWSYFTESSGELVRGGIEPNRPTIWERLLEGQ